MKSYLPDFHHRQEAQSLVEYALIISLVVIVVVAVVTAFGAAVGQLIVPAIGAL